MTKAHGSTTYRPRNGTHQVTIGYNVRRFYFGFEFIGSTWSDVRQYINLYFGPCFLSLCLFNKDLDDE